MVRGCGAYIEFCLMVVSVSGVFVLDCIAIIASGMPTMCRAWEDVSVYRLGSSGGSVWFFPRPTKLVATNSGLYFFSFVVHRVRL